MIGPPESGPPDLVRCLRRRPRGLAVVGVASLLLLWGATLASARLGGGSSYRSGGSSSSSGSSSYSGGRSSFGSSSSGGSAYTGNTDIFVPFAILLALLAFHLGRLRLATLEEEQLARPGAADAPVPGKSGVSIDALRELDRGFSRPVFRDMASSLWVKVHEARGHGNAQPLRRLLGPDAWRRMTFGLPPEQRGHPDSVEEVVLGGLTIRSVEPRGQLQRVTVEIRGNLTEVHLGRPRVLYVEERWVFERPSGTLSPRPQVARSLGCPGCGASAEATVSGTCTFCDEPIPERPLGWVVESIHRTHQEVLPPLQPDRGGVEAGTHLTTRVDPGLSAQMRTLQARHPSFQWADFSKFVEETFVTLQAAWSAQDLDTLRSLETPGLFRTHRFWLERYRKKGWSNRIESLVHQDPELVRVELDAHYEAVVLRFFAEGFDFTLDENHELVAGSRDRKRSFSEYWTFVRAAGATQKTLDAKSCPACGAPRDKLDANGVCGYCDANIMDGEHGWVLGLIEQDEEYLG